MEKVYALDACALIALLLKETGSEKVQNIFDRSSRSECTVYLHRVTLVEVLYDQLRANPELTAEALITVIAALPITITDVLSDSFVATVAGFKVQHRISFADCFVLALATLQDAEILTSDHHEFDPIENSGEVKFAWIR